MGNQIKEQGVHPLRFDQLPHISSSLRWIVLIIKHLHGDLATMIASLGIDQIEVSLGAGDERLTQLTGRACEEGGLT